MEPPADPPYKQPLLEDPQQNTFTFGDVAFSSQFDSGNLQNVVKIDDLNYEIYIMGDYTPNRSTGAYHFWYYFTVTGIPKGSNVSFIFKNIGNQGRLFSFGFRPVYKVEPSSKTWKRITGRFEYYKKENEPFTVRFEHLFEHSPEDVTYFALTFPFSYSHCQDILDGYEKAYLDHPKIYFHRELLATSLGGRRVDLLTITSKENALTDTEDYLPGLFPEGKPRPLRFNKPTIFVTARVHPGETQGSYMMNGLLSFLLNESSKNQQTNSNSLIANMVLSKFVFKIIPMLNPDGVYKGFFRLDTLGQNLNRYYTDPSAEQQPTIYATKKAILQQHQYGALKMFIDLHGHVNKMGTFLYGNAIKGLPQIENVLFAKLLSLNSINFDFGDCNFTESNMVAKDRIDGLSREGSSRVAMYKETSLPNCYTIETSFQGSRKMNLLAPKFNKVKKAIESEQPLTNPYSKLYDGKPAIYTPEIYEDMGRAICNSLLDYYDENPVSRIPNSSYKTIEGVKGDIAQHLNIHITIPYRTKRPTLYGPTATSEGKKKQTAPKTTKESEVTLKKIKELKKEYSSSPSKKKPVVREKSADAAGEPQKALNRGTALLRSQKMVEREDKKKEELCKRKEHKLNNAFFPPIEKTPEVIKKPKQGLRQIKVKIGVKAADVKKAGKVAKSVKRVEGAKGGVKKLKHKS